MSINSKEKVTKGGYLFPLAKLKFGYTPLSQTAITDVFNRVISGGRVTKIGQEFLVDCQEFSQLRDTPNVLMANSLEEAREDIGFLLTEVPGQIGYITGGMEGLHLQILLNGLAATKVETFIIGLEEDSYITSKGRKPLYTTNEKISLWEQLVPDNSVIFVIPQRPDFICPNDYYDWIAQYLGLFRNEQIIYLGSEDDPQDVIFAHQRRATSPKHCLNLSVGIPPLHTTELLVR